MRSKASIGKITARYQQTNCNMTKETMELQRMLLRNKVHSCSLWEDNSVNTCKCKRNIRGSLKQNKTIYIFPYLTQFMYEPILHDWDRSKQCNWNNKTNEMCHLQRKTCEENIECNSTM